MNLEFKSNKDITEVKCDNGEIKNIKTNDNLYDILTIENIIEYLTKLKDDEENNKIRLNKDLKRSRLGKILGTILSGFVSMLSCLAFLYIFINPIYILSFIILLIELGVSVVITDDHFTINKYVKEDINRNKINLEYLEYKINYAKNLLDEFKRNSNYINIEDKKPHKLDVNITNIYKDQYYMFDRLSLSAVDSKKDEPLWQAYEADFNQDEINIVKNARKRILNKK